MRNGILVISIVIIIGILNVYCVFLQLHKQKRNTIHKTYDVSTSAVQISVNFQFLNGKEVVVVWILKIKNSSFLCFCLTVWLLHRHRDSFANEEILFFIDLKQRGSRKSVFQCFLSFIHLVFCNPRIELFQRISEVAREQNITVALTTKGAILTENFCVVCELHIPAQFVLK